MFLKKIVFLLVIHALLIKRNDYPDTMILEAKKITELLLKEL
jgi:hypothetical protein